MLEFVSRSICYFPNLRRVRLWNSEHRGQSFCRRIFAIKSIATGSLRGEPIDLAVPLRVIHCNNPGLASREYTPYRLVVDGQARQVADAPEGAADVWRVEMAGDRAVFFAIERPAE